MNNITKKIVRKEDAVHRQFLGVDFEVLAIGQESMVTKMLYKTKDPPALIPNYYLIFLLFDNQWLERPDKVCIQRFLKSGTMVTYAVLPEIFFCSLFQEFFIPNHPEINKLNIGF